MTNQQLRRFENRAQLLRHISDQTGRDIEDLWDEYESQIDRANPVRKGTRL